MASSKPTPSPANSTDPDPHRDPGDDAQVARVVQARHKLMARFEEKLRACGAQIERITG
jgi:hypothetical protein